jgi:hypothetical protein
MFFIGNEVREPLKLKFLEIPVINSIPLSYYVKITETPGVRYRLLPALNLGPVAQAVYNITIHSAAASNSAVNSGAIYSRNFFIKISP